MFRRDKGRSGQVSKDFNGMTERRGGCVGDRRRGEEARSSKGAYERAGKGVGWKTRRDKGWSDQVSMDFSGRTEKWGGCVGDRRRGEEARSD
jgi:hypothetical protein